MSQKIVEMTAFEDLLTQVEAMLQSSSDPPQNFDAAAWLKAWLHQPSPALNGNRPADLLATDEGYAVVSQVLSCVYYGAYL